MKNAHAKHLQQENGSMSKEIFKGSIASAVVYSGSKIMSNVIKHPVLVFGLGVVAGFFVHKYRKEIIANTTKAVDAGRDFVLQQKENLEDIVAETKE
ncbi:MAG: hypothetical protein Q8N35_09445 [Methylococcaceae bacterium]|jgi:hypothetical protein|nr:hypothetical protein [Methylococcaceae bacterium]MDZ4156198.1 hypothetical protein [Methylococcales bacterium]MDP2393776.1 hypothetical protein [Methylococcaceae bacterium]MDP3019802.1 hypothetical protein [Methylococcaceae bacterium]MDP3389593.1 hypothetical protein [Methylococcaceae bacterium]